MPTAFTGRRFNSLWAVTWACSGPGLWCSKWYFCFSWAPQLLHTGWLCKECALPAHACLSGALQSLQKGFLGPQRALWRKFNLLRLILLNNLRKQCLRTTLSSKDTHEIWSHVETTYAKLTNSIFHPTKSSPTLSTAYICITFVLQKLVSELRPYWVWPL